MNIKNLAVAIAIGLTLLSASDVLAGRGGGRRGGGGGGMRMGGGGGARPSFAGHAPSMSRAVPRASRPSVSRPNYSRPNVSRPNISRPNTSLPGTNRPPTSRPNISRPANGLPNVNRPNANRPNVNRPNVNLPKPGGNRPDLGRPGRPDIGTGNRPDIGRPGRPDLSRPGRPDLGRPGRPDFGGQRPSIGQLDDFLGLPGGVNRPTTLPGKLPGKLPGRPNFSDTNIGDKVGDRFSGNNRDININAGNRVNVGNRVGNNNANAIRDKWNNNVDRPFGNANFWDPGFSRNPNAWRWQHGWNRYPPYWGWRVGSWATVGTYFAWQWATPTPVIYDYGSTVVYRDNMVYVQDEPVATQVAYYEQASTIAESVPASVEPDQVQWMPLGVFAISSEGTTDTGLLIQLAVSKEGIIAGTFYNETTESSRPVEGTVDRESQRVAWQFSDGKNEDVVMESVIHNLTVDESTALVHFGPDKQETWTMLRMEEPTE